MRLAAVVLGVLAVLWPAVPAGAASPSPSVAPSSSPSERPVVIWTKASSPGETGDPVELTWGGRGLLLLTRAAGIDRPTLWWSESGEAWVPVVGPVVAPDVLLEHVTAGFDALAVAGRVAGRPAIWWSRDGTTWVRASRSGLRSMAGVAVRSFGDRFGAPMTAYTDEGSWSSRDGRVWRWHEAPPLGDPVADARQAFPKREAVVAILMGRDGFLAIALPTSGEGYRVATSRNRQDWTVLPEPFTGSPGSIAFASDGGLIAVDRVDPDGAHALTVSTDGQRWVETSAAGDVPAGRGPRLAMRFGTLVLATDEGVWVGRFERHPGADIAVPVVPGAPSLGPIGADPPLRAPVQSSGRNVRPDLARPADDTAQSGGLRLELWVPHRTVRPGDRVVVHVRATNVGSRTIALFCPSFQVVADVTSLHPAGRRWTGHAAELSVSALASDLGRLWFRRWDELGRFCEGGSVGHTVVLRPGERIDVESGHLLKATLGDQALPTGLLPITAEIPGREWDVPDGAPRPTLRVRGAVTVRGPDWPWPGPAQIVDAVLADPRVADAVARTTDGWVVEGSIGWVLKRHPNLVLPPGAEADDLIVLELWLHPSRTGGSFLVLAAIVDPWTAQVIDVVPG